LVILTGEPSRLWYVSLPWLCLMLRNVQIKSYFNRKSYSQAGRESTLVPSPPQWQPKEFLWFSGRGRVSICATCDMSAIWMPLPVERRYLVENGPLASWAAYSYLVYRYIYICVYIISDTYLYVCIFDRAGVQRKSSPYRLTMPRLWFL